MSSIKIEGYDELIKLMDKMPEAVQRRNVLQIFRHAIKPLIKSAKSKLKMHGSGYSNLARAIGTWNGKSRKSPNLFAGPRVKGRWRDIGYMGHWVEYGTSGIKQKNRGTRSWQKTEENEAFAKVVGTLPKGARYRQDQRPKPYMRPAIDEQMPTVRREIEKQMKFQIERIMKKNAKQIKI